MRARRYPDEPGRNDSCLCGSGAKFKKCCGPVYRDHPRDSPWRGAYQEGDFESAIDLLRPEICRYAIWHRSHTVPWHSEDPEAAEQLLEIDILALGDYLSWLQDCYRAADRTDEFAEVLDRFASLIDDPRWDHQVLLQRVYWALGTEWHRERGKELLSGLKLDDVRDPELFSVYLDVFSDELSVPQTLDLCDRILGLTEDPSYRLHYSVLKGILWIFLGEADSAVSIIEGAVDATQDEALETVWGQSARIGAHHLLGAQIDDDKHLAKASQLCREALDVSDRSDKWRASLHQVLGDIAVHLGNHEAALEEYETSLELDDLVPVRISLARCHLALGDVEPACEVFSVLAASELEEGEHVDYVLAKAGLLFLPHDGTLRAEIRERLEALDPPFPMHREARDQLLRYAIELDAEESGLMTRVKRVWESLGSFVILQPNLFGIGVDLKAMGDTLLGVSDRELLERSAEESNSEETA